MKRFIKPFAKAGPVILLFCLSASFQYAFAITINQTGVAEALVADNTDDLNFPGTPLPDYAFARSLNLFMASFPPSDSDSFELGLNPNSFLVTGNTYFNFTGDQKIWIFDRNSAPAIGPNQSFAQQPIPEPGSFWMVAAAFISGAIRMARSRRELFIPRYLSGISV